MCGIAGVFRFHDQLDRIGPVHRVNHMLSVLRKRGPDSSGTFSSLDGLHMGACRLAITDTAGSAQPLYSHDRNLVLVFNGEIYNHNEIRRATESRGYAFQTRGDGEAVMAQYAVTGGGFDKLDGMFSFALWDQRLRKLILGRDRCGIKPLYVYFGDDEILFASEAKAILSDARVPVSINSRAVRSYFDFKFVLPPFSAFEKIEKLEAGTVLTVDPHHIARVRFWTPPRPVSRGHLSGPPPVVDAIRSTCITGAVVFLSGGLDSGAAAALSNQATVKTLSVSYSPGADEDEGILAHDTAAFLDTVHARCEVDARDALSLLVESQTYLDEPVYAPVCLSTLRLCQTASGLSRVVMTGDGADELFLGYEHSRIPMEFPADWEARYTTAIGWLHSRYHDLFLTESPSTSIAELVGSKFRIVDPMECVRYFEFFWRLPEYQLTRLDRISMSHGLEARVPYLRNAVVEWCFDQPVPAMMGGQIDKAPLRSAVAAHVPPFLLKRRKRKFAAPYAEWLRHMKTHDISSLLLDEDYTSAGLDRKALESLVGRYNKREQGCDAALWGVLAFCAWWRGYVVDKIGSSRTLT